MLPFLPGLLCFRWEETRTSKHMFPGILKDFSWLCAVFRTVNIDSSAREKSSIIRLVPLGPFFCAAGEQELAVTEEHRLTRSTENSSERHEAQRNTRRRQKESFLWGGQDHLCEGGRCPAEMGACSCPESSWARSKMCFFLSSFPAWLPPRCPHPLDLTSKGVN